MNFDKPIKEINKKNVGFYLPIEIINKIRTLSIKRNISMNKLIEECIKKEDL